jgi:FkbM family methyltransferase
MNTIPVKKTIEDLMLEKNINLHNDDNFFYIEQNNRVIKISIQQKNYIKTLMRFFDFHFSSVESFQINNKSVVDFSKSKKHKIIGFELFDIYCPSLAEPYGTVKQYLDCAQLQLGDVVLDLGSYSGLTTIAFSQDVGPTGKVIALEPDDTNYSCLIKNVQQLETDNILCLNAAVWNYTGTLEFSSEENMGSSAISIVGSRGTIKQVDCLTLYDISNKFNLERVDFIKCDIEGAEAYIFEDEAFFNKYKPKILLETHIVDGKFCDQICIDILKKYGYTYKEVKQFGLDLPLLEFTI